MQLNSQHVCEDMHSQKFLLECKKDKNVVPENSRTAESILTLRDTEFEMYKI